MASGAIKGITIEFRGDTTSLGKALNDVNKQIKTTDTALKDVNKALKLDPNNVELLAQKEALLNNQIAQTKEQLDLQKRAAQEAAQALADGTITQEEYARLAAAVSTTSTKLTGLEEEAKATSEQLAATGNSAQQAGDKTKEAGDKAAETAAKWEAFGAAAKVACELTIQAISAVVSAVADVAGALANASVETAAWADDIQTLSQVSSVSTQTLQELEYAQELLNVSSDTVVSSLTKLTRSMASAQDGAIAFAGIQAELDSQLANGEITMEEYQEGIANASSAFDRLGVSIIDESGNLRDNEDVFWDVVDALGEIDNEAERDSLAMSILGRSATSLNPLIEAGSDRFRELADEALSVGAVFDDNTLDAFNNLDENMERLGAGTDALKRQLGRVLLPALTELSSGGVTLLNDFTAAIANSDGSIDALGDIIDEFVPRVKEFIEANLPTVLEIGGEILDVLVSGITDNLDTILAVAIEVLLKLAEGIINNLADLAPVIADLVVKLAEFIVNNLPTIITAAIQIVIAVVDGISRSLPELIPAAVACVNQIVGALIDNVSELIPAALELMLGLAMGLIAAIPEILATVPTIINELRDEFNDFIPDLVDAATTWGVDLIANFVSGIRNSIGNLTSELSSIASTVTDYLGFSVPEKGPLHEWAFNNPGADMIDLFTDGMSDEKRALQKALVQTGDIIYNGMSYDYSGQLGMIAGSLDNLGVNKSNGTYIINVMVGNTKLAQAVISAQQMEAYRAGGL